MKTKAPTHWCVATEMSALLIYKKIRFKDVVSFGLYGLLTTCNSKRATGYILLLTHMRQYHTALNLQLLFRYCNAWIHMLECGNGGDCSHVIDL